MKIERNIDLIENRRRSPYRVRVQTGPVNGRKGKRFVMYTESLKRAREVRDAAQALYRPHTIKRIET